MMEQLLLLVVLAGIATLTGRLVGQPEPAREEIPAKRR